MKLRSLLFVPGDRPGMFAKAAASGADALILDLEDSVDHERKREARVAIAEWLNNDSRVSAFVRINALETVDIDADLAMIAAARPDGVALPKVDSATSIERLRARGGDTFPPILAITSETPGAIFNLSTYAQVADHLVGLTWGAEDLAAATGTTDSRKPDGSFTHPYEMVRALTLFGAHAASVEAIETVFPSISDLDGLAACASRAKRDGFTGMMAIHPRQVPVINASFAPSDAEISHAHAVIAAFDARPEAGALQLNGRMIDRPHLSHARRLIQQIDQDH
jgi:citrate lyase subunit beta / citryl-CoA lyase